MTEEHKGPRPLIFVLLDASAQSLGLSMSEKAVLVALAKCLRAKRNGTAVWPGNPTIAAELGAHVETVVKAKRSLHEKGFIKIRRDRGKSDVCTIDDAFIRAIAEPPGKNRGVPRGGKTDPPEKAGGHPPEKPGLTPPKNRDRTAYGTAQLNNLPDIPSFSCSPDLKVGDEHQRQMQLLGVVAEGARQALADAREQPTEEKDDEAGGLARGARRVNERPG